MLNMMSDIMSGNSNSDFDLRIDDIGDYYRVYGPNIVTRATEIPLLSKDGGDTGIRYAVGPDVNTGETKVAWVDYPKSVFKDVDELRENAHIKQIFRRCNVCIAVDRLKSSQPESESRPTTIPRPAVPHTPDMYQPPARPRLSLGDVGLPRYLPFALGLVKSLFMTKFGDVMSTLAISVLADLMSGATSDPAKKRVLQELSDAVVDESTSRMSVEDINLIKNDVAKFVDAYRNDQNILTAFVKASIKDDVLKTTTHPTTKTTVTPKGAVAQLRQLRTMD